MRSSLLRIVVSLVIIALSFAGSAHLLASALASPATPAGCHADGKCGGLTIRFHTAGAARSPSPLWAGRWWFIDDHGVARQGSCTFHRGVHPTYTSPAHRVPLRLPLDPSGNLAAYLTWRYGTSADSLTSAALWAVLHHYALDAADATRSSVVSAPLVERLDRLAVMTGRLDLQQRAITLDREARSMSGPWKVSARVDRADAREAVVTVQVRTSSSRPVPDVPVTVLMSGRDAPLAVVTSTDGTVSRRVPLPANPGTVTIVALVTVPGRAEAYQGVPALPSQLGSQTLVAAGPPRQQRVLVRLSPVPTSTTTTVPLTTTTVPPTTTTVPPTTTTVPPTTTTTTTTTTTVPPTTGPPPTYSPRTPSTATPRTTVPATIAPTTAAALPPPLPRTGGRPDGGIALLATALLVGGVGVLGTLRRGHLHSGE